jgi:uncharacterized coiled-coil protein SlyX
MAREGVKYDGDKPRWGLLPFREVQDVVDVLTAGSKKYSDDNWKYVDNAKERYYDAMLRHISQYRFAKERDMSELIFDDETGKSHLAHAICCALFIMWFDHEESTLADDYDFMMHVLDDENEPVAPNKIKAEKVAYVGGAQIEDDTGLDFNAFNEKVPAGEPIPMTPEDERINDLETIIKLNDNEVLKRNEYIMKLEERSADNEARIQELENLVAQKDKAFHASEAHLQHVTNANEHLRLKNNAAAEKLIELETRFKEFDRHANVLLEQKAQAAENLKGLNEIIDIQASDGNWNYDPYMQGMANGMLLARHTILGLLGDVPYKEAPEHWLKDDDQLIGKQPVEANSNDSVSS